MAHDLIIRGGTVVDGTGAPPRTADVVIDGDRIVEVGRSDGSARREVDADGGVTLEGGTPLPDILNQPVPAVSPLAVFVVLGLATRSRIIRA